MFPADVRKWPSGVEGGPGMHPMAQDIEDVYKYINLTRESGQVCHEVHTEAFNCTSDRARGMLAYVIFPEPSKGFSSVHHYLYWARCVQAWYQHSLRTLGVATDSCSTGLGAATALMAPTEADVAAGVLFLGLPDRDFIYAARYAGAREMADGKRFNYFVQWYGDWAHLARTARRNLAYDSRSLLYVSHTGVGTHECAMMEALIELQQIMPRAEAAFLTDVVQINKWRDQKGDAALFMIRASTIEMLRKHRPKFGNATALYLTTYNYSLEPWINPDLTNPMAITFNAWVGYTLALCQELYVVKVEKLDKDLYLPSYQLVRTTALMAHAATDHCLHVKLDFSHRLDEQWTQAALRAAATMALEGCHSEGRTGSVSKASAGDCNFTVAKWPALVSKLQRIRWRRIVIGLHGWKGRAVRNMQRVDKITTLRDVKQWGCVPDTPEYAPHCGNGGYLPPASYADFLADLTSAKREAQDAGLLEFERWNPLAVEQMKAAGCWPGLWRDGDGTRWHELVSARLSGAKILRGEEQLPPMAPPPTPDEVERSLDKALKVRMQQADREAAKAREKVATHLREKHGLSATDLEREVDESAAATSDSSDLGIAQLAAKAQAQYEGLQAQLAASEGTRVIDEFGQDLSRLASGMQLRDQDGRLQNTERVINAGQHREQVARDRGKRFMLFASEEERRAAEASGHNCCRGSLLVVRVGLFHVALARVIRLKLLGASGAASEPKSFTLAPGSAKQSFQLELLYPDGVVTVTDAAGEEIEMLQFGSTGRELPHCSAEKVLRLVATTSLHPVRETIFARMMAVDSIALRTDNEAGGLKPWATLEQLQGTAALLAPELQLPDSTLCFACHVGWSDDTTGPLLACKGGCKRAFHASCHPHFPLETQICGRCSGVDTEICCKCDLEWSDPDPKSDFFSGEMVGCDGTCGRWFHQHCHSPIITSAQVQAPQWFCSDCGSGRQTAATECPTAPAAQVLEPPPAVEAESAVQAQPPMAEHSRQELSKTIVLKRSQQGYGFGITLQGLVDRVNEGSAAAVAGLQVDDVVLQVNGARLQHGVLFVSQLRVRQREGVRLTLVVQRRRECDADADDTDAPAAGKRRRTQVVREGMQSGAGVRMADAQRSHAARLVDGCVHGL